MQTRRNESLLARYPVDIDRLRHLLLDLRMSRYEASLDLGIPIHALDVHCQHHKIQTGRARNVHKLSFQERETVVAAIRVCVEDGLDYNQTALRLGISPKRVSELACKAGIKGNRRGPKSGSGHPDWGGGRVLDKDGYVLLYMPGHHLARECGKRAPVYVPEHRLVMERSLGRPLLDTEVVHHRDKNKQNNDISNLELYESNAQHLREELAGHCPKWTEDGIRRILEGVRKPRKKREPTQTDQAEDGSQTQQS